MSDPDMPMTLYPHCAGREISSPGAVAGDKVFTRAINVLTRVGRSVFSKLSPSGQFTLETRWTHHPLTLLTANRTAVPGSVVLAQVVSLAVA